MSDRKLAGRFGVARGTVQSMLKHVEKVKREDFGSTALDPGTGWPRWKHVKGSAWQGGVEAMDPDQRRKWRAEKLAAKLGKLLDSADKEVLALALSMLKQETTDGGREAVMSDIRAWSAANQRVTY